MLYMNVIIRETKRIFFVDHVLFNQCKVFYYNLLSIDYRSIYLSICVRALGARTAYRYIQRSLVKSALILSTSVLFFCCQYYFTLNKPSTHCIHSSVLRDSHLLPGCTANSLHKVLIKLRSRRSQAINLLFQTRFCKERRAGGWRRGRGRNGAGQIKRKELRWSEERGKK